MGHLSYEEGKKRVVFGLFLLGGVTVAEVFFSLLGKGHVVASWGKIVWLDYVVGIILIALSLYKAYFIIYEFMHLRYEVKALAMTVLLPTALLIWAIIAFFQEGDSWLKRREQIKEKDEAPADGTPTLQGMLSKGEVYPLELRR
jgi:cytochrome c oxidase subunit 4